MMHLRKGNSDFARGASSVVDPLLCDIVSGYRRALNLGTSRLLHLYETM